MVGEDDRKNIFAFHIYTTSFPLARSREVLSLFLISSPLPWYSVYLLYSKRMSLLQDEI